jgi:hypothetical protein
MLKKFPHIVYRDFPKTILKKLIPENVILSRTVIYFVILYFFLRVYYILLSYSVSMEKKCIYWLKPASKDQV